MGMSKIRGGQIKDDSITGDDVDESTLILDTLRDADGDTKIQIEESADEDKIRFDTAGSERMIITEAGLVGIGTDDPDNTLHISSSGDTHLKIQSDGGSYPALKMKSGAAGSTYVWTPADTSDIRLYAGGADRMHIDNDGNVGIGTTDPQTTLHIVSDVMQFRVEDTTTDYTYTIDCEGAKVVTHFGGVDDEAAFMSFGAYGGINKLDTSIRDFHLFGSNTTTGFYLDESAGNFGIGTTTPKTGLDTHHSPVSLADNTGGGECVTFGAGTTTAGKLYYLNGDSPPIWAEIDASAVATGADQMVGIALGTSSADGILIRGFFDATTYLSSFSAGKAVYMSETAASMTTTAPTSVGAIIRIMGYCTDTANVIYFNPSNTWIEL